MLRAILAQFLVSRYIDENGQDMPEIRNWKREG